MVLIASLLFVGRVLVPENILDPAFFMTLFCPTSIYSSLTLPVPLAIMPISRAAPSERSIILSP